MLPLGLSSFFICPFTGMPGVADAQDELLVSACERIWACEDPAYLKNGEMRYLAVNAAFARLFNRQPADFIGLRGD